jgi:dihydrofolate reductase
MHPDSRYKRRGDVQMRKMFAFLVATVDGYYEGQNQEFDWPIVDEEFNEFSVRQLDEVDMLVFGRVTYELMASYWPTPAAKEDDPRVAARMNELPKLVISRTLENASWANTRLIRNNVAEELTEVKQQPGMDIAILGSSALTVDLLPSGLVDELRIMVNPIILGAGKSMFKTADQRIGLTLLEARPFTSGNVLLRYTPAIRGD